VSRLLARHMSSSSSSSSSTGKDPKGIVSRRDIDRRVVDSCCCYYDYCRTRDLPATHSHTHLLVYLIALSRVERSVAAQLYEDIFKDTIAAATGTAPAASSSTTTTAASATPASNITDAPDLAASSETKAQIWRDLFANRLLSKPDANYQLHPEQRQDTTTFLREDNSSSRAATFKIRTTELWEKLLVRSDPSAKSVDRVQQLLDDSIARSFTPEATTLFSRYPRTIKSWLINSFVRQQEDEQEAA